MTVTHHIDEEARRVVMTVGGAATGGKVSDLIEAMVADRPELIGWDWIHDVRASSGEVDVADANRVARAFADAPPGQTYTVFVTHDANLALWCQVLDHEFPSRRHLIAHTLDGAHAHLDRLRADDA